MGMGFVMTVLMGVMMALMLGAILWSFVSGLERRDRRHRLPLARRTDRRA
jgi:hypothetical protein